MNSIIQEGNSVCYLCGLPPNGDALDKHHCIGGSRRKLSEKYGLTVYLHHNKCHVNGKNSVHRNAELSNGLKKIAQKKAMDYYGWSKKDFIRIFGKNYI